MSIAGIGADIVEAARFRKGLVSERLMSRVFTDAERSYCNGQRFPELHLAARFAAKESAVKALLSILPRLLVSQIEVVRSKSGAPSLRLVKGLCSPPPPPLPDGLVLHVSLSHAGWYGAATVVAEWVD